MNEDPELPEGPHLTTKELGKRWGNKTPNAIHILRHRRRAPKGFRVGGILLFPLAEVEAFERAKQEADSRFNTELDPTAKPVEARRAPRRRTAPAA